jgi:hypothetical protein
MPILSINFGVANVRGVYLSDEGEISDYVINYSYIKEFYAHFYSEKEFYTDITDHFIKKMKVPKRGLQVIATGFPKIPAISYDYSHTLPTEQLFNQVSDFDVVSLSNNTVFTQKAFINFAKEERIAYGEAESNYLKNLTIYKNVFPSRPSDYNLILSNIWNTVNKKRSDSQEVILRDLPTLFLGDVFSMPPVEGFEFEKIAYLHILSIIVNPGIFSLHLDKTNIFPNLFHLKLYRPDLGYVYDNFKPESLGTLINSPGETTCLIESEIGTSQLVDITVGKLIFIPLDSNSKVRVVVKSSVLGSVEKRVSGGHLGLVLDTRQKNDRKIYDHEQLQIDINANLKNIEQVMSKI